MIQDPFLNFIYSETEKEIAGLRSHLQVMKMAAEIMPPRHSPRIVEKKPGRNEDCPCGSGKKYKKCCIEKE